MDATPPPTPQPKPPRAPLRPKMPSSSKRKTPPQAANDEEMQDEPDEWFALEGTEGDQGRRDDTASLGVLGLDGAEGKLGLDGAEQGKDA